MNAPDIETLRRKQALLQSQIDTIEARPEDIFDEYTVLRFRRRSRVWNGAKNRYEMTTWFHYVAIKVGEAWYVSSLTFKSKRTWTQLMAWWEEGEVKRVLVATSWARFDEYLFAREISREKRLDEMVDDLGPGEAITRNPEPILMSGQLIDPPTDEELGRESDTLSSMETPITTTAPKPMSTAEAVAILQGVSERLDPSTTPGKVRTRVLDAIEGLK